MTSRLLTAPEIIAPPPPPTGLPPTVERAGPGQRFALFCWEFVRHTKGIWAGQRFVLEEFQRAFADELFRVGPDGLRIYKEALLGIPRKNGKALAVDTPIPTPDGWVPMGDLQVGDLVFGDDGRPCRVVGVTDVMLGRPCYQLRFSDGAVIVADEQHEWLVEPRWLRSRLVTTGEMVGRVKVGHRATHNEHRYRIPLAGPLETEIRALPVAPYTLGVWLGDGHTDSAAVTSGDPEVFVGVAADGYTIGHDRTARSGSAARGIGIQPRGAGGSLQATMRRSGILGRKAIPAAYQRAAPAQRLALLQGLMDTDGHVTPRGQCEFTTTSAPLAEGFVELARTLGLKPTTREGRAMLDGRDVGPKWRIQFWPGRLPAFRLERKLRRQKGPILRRARSTSRHIVAIDPVPSVPVRCIEVDSPSHLYLAGEAMVPTHNSSTASALALYLLIADGENEPEVYAAAASKKQARIMFDQAKKFVRRSPSLQDFVRPYRDTIICPENDGKFEVVSSDAPLQHGLNPSGNVIDELHAHQDPDLYDALTSGSGAREQPLTVTITTAGWNKESVLGDIYEKAMALPAIERPSPYLTIARDVENGFLFWWYAAPADAQIDDPAVWRGCNPASWITDAYLRRELNKPTMRLSIFRMLHGNQWVPSEEAWLPAGAWEAGEAALDPVSGTRALELVPEAPTFVAVDIAMTHDYSAVTRVQLQADKLVTRTRFWFNPFPAGHPDHGTWEMDIAAVREYLRELRETYLTPAAFKPDSKVPAPGPAFLFDPWKFKESAQILRGEGLNMIDFPQYDRYMVPACNALYEAVKAGRISHDGDPIVAEHMANARGEARDRGWRIRKPKGPNGRELTEKHIDGAITNAMAIYQAQLGTVPTKSTRPRSFGSF